MLHSTEVIYQLFMIFAGCLTPALLSRLKGMLVSGLSLPIFSCIFIFNLFIHTCNLHPYLSRGKVMYFKKGVRLYLTQIFLAPLLNFLNSLLVRVSKNSKSEW